MSATCIICRKPAKPGEVVLPDLPDAHTAWVEAAQEEEGGEGR